MKKLYWPLLIVLFSLHNLFGVDASRIVTDPVSDYISRHKTDLRKDDQKNEHLISLQIDVDNDGKQDVFLSSEQSGFFDDGSYENKVYIWDLYKKIDDSHYILLNAQKFKAADGSEHTQDSEFDFDPRKIYVGYIREVKAWGLLATYYLPKHSEAEFSALVLRDGYFEELNFPNPSKPVGIYHRDDANTIVDLPKAFTHYVTSPSTAKVVVLPQTY